MPTTSRYSMTDIKEKAQQLVQKGCLDRQQRIYTLCQFLPCDEWQRIESELEKNGFLLRDHLIDLLSAEEWIED